jgi:hypothetical protein
MPPYSNSKIGSLFMHDRETTLSLRGTQCIYMISEESYLFQPQIFLDCFAVATSAYGGAPAVLCGESNRRIRIG